jgi:hypothetical protein
VATLAAAAIGLLAVTGVARTQDAPTPVAQSRAATETWVCSDQAWSPHDKRPPIELSLKDGLLIEQPLGAPRYELLVNNTHALIGVDHYGDFDPVLGMVNIFVTTVTIDRATGDFTLTTSVRHQGHEHRTGRCRKFEQRSQPDAVVRR